MQEYRDTRAAYIARWKPIVDAAYAKKKVNSTETAVFPRKFRAFSGALGSEH